jgi:hypothetical protein
MLIEGASRNKFLDKKAVVNGEFVQIADAGWTEESTKFQNKDGSPKVRRMFNIKRAGETLTTELNWTSIKGICAMYGGETTDWVGKWLKIETSFDRAKNQTQMFFVPVDASKNKELNGQTPEENQGKLTPDKIDWNE